MEQATRIVGARDSPAHDYNTHDVLGSRCKVHRMGGVGVVEPVWDNDGF